MMATVTLAKIVAMHGRSTDPDGAHLKVGGRECRTGVMLAQLDEAADGLTNFAAIDFDNNQVQLNWQIMVSMPILADLVDGGLIPEELSGPVRIALYESGSIRPDGSGIDVRGSGTIGPESLFSSSSILVHINGFATLPAGRKASKVRNLLSGNKVRFRFDPSSYIEVKFADELGGMRERIHMTGGFVLSPTAVLFEKVKGRKTKRSGQKKSSR